MSSLWLFFLFVDFFVCLFLVCILSSFPRKCISDCDYWDSVSNTWLYVLLHLIASWAVRVSGENTISFFLQNFKGIAQFSFGSNISVYDFEAKSIFDFLWTRQAFSLQARLTLFLFLLFGSCILWFRILLVWDNMQTLYTAPNSASFLCCPFPFLFCHY